MTKVRPLLPFGVLLPLCLAHAELPPPFPGDPEQALERTCFQTSQPWSPRGNLRSDVALVYGIGPSLPKRMKSWRDRGYRIHVMTGVSWGEYQDYLYGRFDGENHVDNAQTDRDGKVISHGGDVYYMCPAENFGDFLARGIQQALEAGAEAVHLEEPEFWARAGYSEGFKREWKAFYKEDWQDPQATVDAQWKASKLKYYLYRRALQQVFDHVAAFNRKTGKKIRCYVPTHSLLNYAHWRIVSPQSSLARIDGCDGYIAQVWTGTSRTPNHFRGVGRERTFETAFLEYGAMQNLVRATGRGVWYLNDPIEDNPRHDWNDYRTNWESTLVASLLQPEVAQYEVAPWPERIFGGKYPRGAAGAKPIPPEYATELQVVMHALADMKQPDHEWDCGTRGIGVLVSDTLMFQREQPSSSDPDMGHFYGLALPALKRGIPVTPVQLDNITLPGFLDDQKVLVLTYEGQKPQGPEVHDRLAEWVRNGGVLLVADDDRDPYNQVKEWWNDGGTTAMIPLRHLFAALGVADDDFKEESPLLDVGKGAVAWLRRSPVDFSRDASASDEFAATLKTAVEKSGTPWRETDHLLLRRGPYYVAAGLDESPAGGSKVLEGRFVNLFDPELKVRTEVAVSPGSRTFLLDLERIKPGQAEVLASACKALPKDGTTAWTVEGVGDTPAVVLIKSARVPASVTLDGVPVPDVTHDAENGLLYIRFHNTSAPRELALSYD
ncbi:DUF4350 domain-containing protein [Luteolibacter marinus]|uniref:DUF4350 domain-containing protein n=1 Tax=Luteolibacter marinus TaxID=2776705 RepID=UPI0018673F18|nr:DUF4350 domain-containing protein [Luteolibacter marinus]